LPHLPTDKVCWTDCRVGAGLNARVDVPNESKGRARRAPSGASVTTSRPRRSRTGRSEACSRKSI